MTWRSINCAYVRLAQIVGLNRVVDTTYRMAQSVYLYPGQPAEERRPIEPFVSYSTGANEMSPLDMASGGQTIANGGLHHEPYYVEDIDAADGRRIYTHADAGTQVLDRGVALTAVDVLKGVLRNGHRPALPARRSAGGRQDRDPGGQHQRLVRRLHARADDVGLGRRSQRLHADGEHPRVRRATTARASRAAGTRRRSGRRTWTRRWPAPPSDWEAPPPPARPAARLYLPGNECLAQGGHERRRRASAPCRRCGSRRRRHPSAGRRVAAPPQPRHPAETPRSRRQSRPPTATPPRAGLAGSPRRASPGWCRSRAGRRCPPTSSTRAPIPSTPLSSTVIRC